LAHHPGTQAPDLRLALSRFSTWLSTDEVVSSPRLTKLSSPALQTRIHTRALKKVAKAYGDVVKEVKKSENRYEAVSVVLGNERPFGRVDLLESIFGVEGDE
jgi:conserved oligomeric Golgi complex subunit 6